MIKVYIASPYTLGWMPDNVRESLKCADDLLRLGFAPYAPLLSHFQNIAFPQPEKLWLKVDLEWVRVCDCLLRLPGESKGADGEVALADELDKPIYYSIDELIRGEGSQI